MFDMNSFKINRNKSYKFHIEFHQYLNVITFVFVETLNFYVLGSLLIHSNFDLNFGSLQFDFFYIKLIS